MWKCSPIRNSEFVIFNNFDIFYAIAKQIKGCHYYYLSKEDRKMYGCNMEGFSLHVVDIPEIYEIVESIYFNILMLNETKINQYASFILYRDYPWVMFPTATINDHKDYEFKHVDGSWIIYHNNNPVDFITLYNPEIELFDVRKIITVVNSFKAMDPYLGELKLFGNMETNPIIRTVFDNKVTIGRKYLRLVDMTDKRYGMMIFKNLFNLNKADSLTIVIRENKLNSNTFQASFITVKKKSPIPTIIPFYTETTYAMFINIE